jgi:SAM-dependent methyltransferase
MDKHKLINYFEKSWQPDFSKFTHSGWALLDEIAPWESVLDIGCGYNLFKEHLGTRLLGIDLANDAADIRVSIEEFDPGDVKWDAIFCLGSLNFGDRHTVFQQVMKAVSLCRPGGRIYWRQNPGINDHPFKGVEEVVFFPWTIELNYEWAELLGCTVRECKWDGSRIYSEWRKNV